MIFPKKKKKKENYFPPNFPEFYLFIYFDWENNCIVFGAAGRGPVSELLELLLGAGSLGDLEDVEAHGLAQGPALAHRDDVADLDVPVEGSRAGLGEALFSADPEGVLLSLGGASQLWLL